MPPNEATTAPNPSAQLQNTERALQWVRTLAVEPHMSLSITIEEKLQFFTSLLAEDAIDFWQAIRVTPDTTIREVIRK